MPHIDYPNAIAESTERLHELEKRYRYTHLFQRVRMLGLLKSAERTDLGGAAKALGYSRRQCQRWWNVYTTGGLGELLVSRVDERGRQELVGEEAYRELEEVMKEGEVATYAQARAFLGERGIEYASADSVGGLLRRRKAKLKLAALATKRCRPTSRRLSKKFADLIRGTEGGSGRPGEPEKPLKVLAFDEARFGLINWHRRRYCPRGFRPPYIVGRRYEWSYLYAALDPTTGESFCAYLPRVDGASLEAYLGHLGREYADHRLAVVLDNAPSHTSKEIALPENIELLALPTCSPELNPVERWFQEFRRALSNRIFETIESLQAALTEVLEPYWRDPGRLRNLTGYPWWRQAIESLGHQ